MRENHPIFDINEVQERHDAINKFLLNVKITVVFRSKPTRMDFYEKTVYYRSRRNYCKLKLSFQKALPALSSVTKANKREVAIRSHRVSPWSNLDRFS